MTTSLRIFALILIITYFLVIIKLLIKRKFALKYSLLWLFSGGVMLIIALWPNILFWGTNILGIEVPSNGLFAISIFLVVVIMVSLTSVISEFAIKIKGMIQCMALMEKRIRILEDRLKEKNKDESNGK